MEEKEELLKRLDKIELKIETIISMLKIKNRQVDETEYLEFINKVTKPHHIPYPVYDDDEILGV